MRGLELIFLIIYLVAVLTLGIVYRRTRSDEDYVIGSRRINRFGTTMALFASLVTESLIFFAVSLTAVYGPLGALAGVAGPTLGLLTLSLIAPKVHSEGVENRYISVTEYCRKKWGPFSGRLARLVLLMLLAWVVVLQINLNEKIMAGITGWTPVQTTLLTVTIVLFYTILGGYRAVISTDIFQGMVVGMMFLLPFIIAPVPNLAVVFDTRLLSVNVLLIFLTSFALTITRPEMWQRIYSASTGRNAAQSMRIVALIFFSFGCCVVYYAIAINQSAQGLTPDKAFAIGFRLILPPVFASLFPVILLAAMMASMDSAAFLLSADLASSKKELDTTRRGRTRLLLVCILLGAAIISLTIFNSLAFAYKLNGIVALFSVPLLMSFLLSVPGKLIGSSILAGLVVYTLMLITGRLDRNPVEAIIAGLITGCILLVSYVIYRYFSVYGLSSTDKSTPGHIS